MILRPSDHGKTVESPPVLSRVRTADSLQGGVLDLELRLPCRPMRMRTDETDYRGRGLCSYAAVPSSVRVRSATRPLAAYRSW